MGFTRACVLGNRWCFGVRPLSPLVVALCLLAVGNSRASNSRRGGSSSSCPQIKTHCPPKVRTLTFCICLCGRRPSWDGDGGAARVRPQQNYEFDPRSNRSSVLAPGAGSSPLLVGCRATRHTTGGPTTSQRTPDWMGGKRPGGPRGKMSRGPSFVPLSSIFESAAGGTHVGFVCTCCCWRAARGRPGLFLGFENDERGQRVVMGHTTLIRRRVLGNRSISRCFGFHLLLCFLGSVHFSLSLRVCFKSPPPITPPPPLPPPPTPSK